MFFDLEPVRFCCALAEVGDWPYAWRDMRGEEDACGCAVDWHDTHEACERNRPKAYTLDRATRDAKTFLEEQLRDARGQFKAVFATTIPSQKYAIPGLKECGFKAVGKFRRRQGGHGLITLWFKRLA